MTSNRRRPKKNNLYFLLRELFPHIQNEDDFGSFIGYTVIDSLFASPFRGNTQTESQLEVVRRVYRSFDSAIAEFGGGAEFDHSFSNLRQRVDPMILQAFREIEESGKLLPVPEDTGALFYEFVNYSSQGTGNYEQHLKVDGLYLHHLVKERGIVRADARQILLGDYNQVQTSFTREKR